MLKIIFFGLALLGSTACSGHKNNEPKKIKIFLLAGQSNMDGRAKARDLSDDDRKRLTRAQQNVTLYYNFGEGQPLDAAKVADHLAKKFGADSLFGPELFFGIELSEKYPDNKIVLIKRSKGGMSLYGAWDPDWDKEHAAFMNEEEAPKMYSEFVEYSRKVLSSFDKDSYELCGMLWVQGEADSKRSGPAPAEAYEANLRKLVNRVRTDFESPELPFILLQVGSGKVVEGMRNIAKEDENVVLIPNEKEKDSQFYYEKNPPPIGHYTYKGMKKIGTYFFEFYENWRFE